MQGILVPITDAKTLVSGRILGSYDSLDSEWPQAAVHEKIVDPEPKSNLSTITVFTRHLEGA